MSAINESEEEVKDSAPDESPEQIGRNIFKKIDDQNLGYIDKSALRRYTIRQLKEVYP